MTESWCFALIGSDADGGAPVGQRVPAHRRHRPIPVSMSCFVVFVFCLVEIRVLGWVLRNGACVVFDILVNWERIGI